MNEQQDKVNKIIASATLPNGRETVGKVATDLAQKAPESRDPIELQREMTENYLKELILCIETHKKTYDSSFYAIVITKNEKLLPNVFRNYFTARNSCPTPDYDQSVYYYNAPEENIEYLWTVPSKDAIIHLVKNYKEIHPDERELLKFCLQFMSGDLNKIAKQRNGEEPDSIILA